MRPRLALTFAFAAAVVAVAAIAALSAAPPQQASAGQQILRPGNGVSYPTLLHQETPQYPEAAMRAKIEGSVELEAVVLADGTVGDVRVLKSLDQASGLDAEAIAVAKKWLFKPALKDGKPVPVIVTLILEFRLDKTPRRQAEPPTLSPDVPTPPSNVDEFLNGAYPATAPGLVAPKLMKRVEPQYTREALKAKTQGFVEVEAVVLADGTVGRSRVTKSLDKGGGLDNEALKAINQWTFEPGRLNGLPVPVVVTVQFQFLAR
jgi:TonB family protein